MTTLTSQFSNQNQTKTTNTEGVRDKGIVAATEAAEIAVLGTSELVRAEEEEATLGCLTSRADDRVDFQTVASRAKVEAVVATIRAAIALDQEVGVEAVEL